MTIGHKLLNLTLFLYPFYYFFKAPNIDVLNPYYAGMSVLFILAVIHIIKFRGKYGFNAFDFCLLLYCISFMLSTYLADDPFRSGYLAFRAIFVPVATYIVIKTFAGSLKELNSMTMSLLYGLTAYIVIGLAVSSFTGQRGGILNQTPVAASALAASLFAMVVFSNLRHKTWAKIAVGLALLLTFFTYSRMSYLVIILSPLLYLFIRRGHFLWIFTFLFPFLLAVSLLLPLNKEHLKHNYVSTAKLATIERVTTLSFYKRALMLRANQWGDGIEQFKKKPVLGSGIEEYEDVITYHNFHIEWLAYGGLINYTLVFLSFLIFSILNRKTGKIDNWSAIYLLLLTNALLNAFTNGMMHGIRPDLVFMFVGFAEANRKLKTNQSTPPETKPQLD